MSHHMQLVFKAFIWWSELGHKPKKAQINWICIVNM